MHLIFLLQHLYQLSFATVYIVTVHWRVSVSPIADGSIDVMSTCDACQAGNGLISTAIPSGYSGTLTQQSAPTENCAYAYTLVARRMLLARRTA